jgi:hypothetical protein
MLSLSQLDKLVQKAVQDRMWRQKEFTPGNSNEWKKRVAGRITGI